MADIECRVLEDEYVTASQIVCRTETPASSYDRVRDYNLYVLTKPSSLTRFNEIENRFSSLDEEAEHLVYRFIEPEVLSIEPRKGIKSGGTLLRIVGRNLACGSEFTIKFIANAGLCKIVNVTTQRADSTYSLINDVDHEVDEIYCRTPAYNPAEWMGTKTTLHTGLQIKVVFSLKHPVSLVFKSIKLN